MVIGLVPKLFPLWDFFLPGLTELFESGEGPGDELAVCEGRVGSVLWETKVATEVPLNGVE